MHLSSIYFVRHGQSDNPQSLVKGRLPGFPLTNLGRQQIELTAKYLRQFPIGLIFSSPLLRAQQSANILQKFLNLPPVKIEQRLTEWDMAPWSGQPYSAKQNTDPKLWYAYQETPDLAPFAEKLPQIAVRIQQFIASVLQSHAGEQIIAVTHSDIIKAACFVLQNKPLRAIHTTLCRLASVTAMHFDGNRFTGLEYTEPASQLEPIVYFE